MATNEKQFPAGTYWVENTLTQVVQIRVDDFWVNVPPSAGYACKCYKSIYFVGIPSLRIYRIADDSIFSTS